MAASPGTLGFQEFLWGCFLRAIKSALGLVGLAGMAIRIVGSFWEDVINPWSGPGWRFLTWSVPLVVGGVTFFVAMLRSAHTLYQEGYRQGEVSGVALAETSTKRTLKDELGRMIQRMQRARHGLSVLSRDREPDAQEKAYDLLREVYAQISDKMGIHYAVRIGGILERPDLGTSLDAIVVAKLEEAEAEMQVIIRDLGG